MSDHLLLQITITFLLSVWVGFFVFVLLIMYLIVLGNGVFSFDEYRPIILEVISTGSTVLSVTQVQLVMMKYCHHLLSGNWYNCYYV